MNNLKFKLVAVIGSSLSLCTSLVEAQSINVALDRNAASGPLTIATSAQNYDAVDTADSGTTWNNVYTKAGVGQSSSLTTYFPAGTAAGTYQFYYGVSLENSAGAASGVSLSASMTFGSSDSHNEYNNQSPASGAGLLAQAARLYSGSDTATWTFSGLTAGAQYNLYLIGVGGSSGYGATYTLAGANDGSGFNSGEVTDDSQSSSFVAATDDTYWDGSGNVINGPGTDPLLANISSVDYGIAWIELNAVADSSGNLSFTESKESGGQDYISAIQLQPIVSVPEPSTFALAGLGILGFGWMNRRLRR